MPEQKTFIMLKPDVLKRGLMGAIISRIEDQNYFIERAQVMELDKQMVAHHYAHLLNEDFYPELESYMLSGPVFAMVVTGDNVIDGMRKIIGATDPRDAAPHTIRADFARNVTENAIHGSDTEENAAIEITRFFNSYE
ncbi:nucleoside-diphosphate kinase [Aerococcus urinaeequi]|jgi:nucleoside-diphosphate kinase|uniref:Nucleoside diphosphate kinase n=3 Tax=Aerococcus TaxID=1375 RepID=A0AAU8U2N6_9LACT|nr:MULTISPECIES: nucleoside-diphosphate kinase [Aerococcus]AMC00662.1 nucleoside-diphosphate kinase [Aerococcus viridans]EFG50342.1 nucleoside diphosphate kinase [Aerococcus viridans ATCC 11563 = CCUG 4311]MBR2129635.1 nucleoside-diphosphate kinase [Aerococcus sp.]MEB7389229.1 nucleoside-diphosphate kinase [Aerococcus viridans]WCG38250.1 nucleoside-diphosphate kinase [Aerococcus urinaeequi]